MSFLCAMPFWMSNLKEKRTLRLWSLSLVVVLGKRDGNTYRITKSNPGDKLRWWKVFPPISVWVYSKSQYNVYIKCSGLIVFLTVINLEVGSADGLSCFIRGNTSVGTSVFCAHIHQDEAVLAPWACYFVSFGIRLDPQHIFYWFLL